MKTIPLKTGVNNLMSVLNKRKERLEYEEMHQAEEIKRREEFDQYYSRFNTGNYQTNEKLYKSSHFTSEELKENK